jgi:catechol 2,3-dioxygenase-like lactoylglutathione lyase family enzyme
MNNIYSGLSGARGKRQTSGFHHIALVVKDMTRTIHFYETCLGMRCRAVYPMHNVPGAKHCFLDAGNGNEISFVEFSQPKAGTPGISYPATNASESPVTTLHHMAYRVETLDQLYAIREQVKQYGLSRPSKVIDHHFIHSFYFSDPDGFHLEVTCTVTPYTADEYQPEILKRKLNPTENDWDEPASMKRAEEMAKKVLSKTTTTTKSKL